MYDTCVSSEYLELLKSQSTNGFRLILRIKSSCFPKHWSPNSCSEDEILKYVKELKGSRVLVPSDHYKKLKYINK